MVDPKIPMVFKKKEFVLKIFFVKNTNFERNRRKLLQKLSWIFLFKEKGLDLKIP